MMPRPYDNRHKSLIIKQIRNQTNIRPQCTPHRCIITKYHPGQCLMLHLQNSKASQCFQYRVIYIHIKTHLRDIYSIISCENVPSDGNQADCEKHHRRLSWLYFSIPTRRFQARHSAFKVIEKKIPPVAYITIGG